MYELSNDEKAYLKKMIINKRIEFFNKHKYVLLEDNIETVDEKLLISIENIEINFEIKSDGEICAPELEKVFRDEDLINIVKALTLREKLVLFSYYFENKTDKQIGQAFNIKGDTASKVRNRALEKIRKEYKKMKGGK